MTYRIGSAVVDLICENATIELISLMSEKRLSLPKKKRS
jgi:hypothetical protein